MGEVVSAVTVVVFVILKSSVEQLYVGNSKSEGVLGRLYAPILIHKGNASPMIPPETQP